MEAFDELIKVADRLNSPDGCPWDIKQTFESLARYVLEEAHEVVDAVYHSDDSHLLEELGDLFYTVIFYSKVAEREDRFTLEAILDCLREKLIRRHPHVFGDVQIESDEDVVNVWNQVKSEEKKNHPSRPFDDLPKDLPVLQRASKVLKRVAKECPEHLPSHDAVDYGDRFLYLVLECRAAGVDPDSVLRKALATCEKNYTKAHS